MLSKNPNPTLAPAGRAVAGGLLAALLAAAPAATQTRPTVPPVPPRVLGRPADTLATRLDSIRRATPAPQGQGPRLLGRAADTLAARLDSVQRASPAPSPSAALPAMPPQPTGPRLLGRAVGGVAGSAAPAAPAAPARLLGRTVVAAAPAGGVPGSLGARPDAVRCGLGEMAALGRDPLPGELRCVYGAHGPGRFGLLSYQDVPVYQPRTPLPGTHVVGIPGLPGPQPGEGFEEWEWRVLTTRYGPEVQRVYNGLEMLDPVVASKIVRFERALAEAGIAARRRETFRLPERQAYIFQQGRSRPGPIATSTLTSWHSRVDRLGRPAGRAVDYDVAPSRLARFHEIAASVGLEGYGSDSNDPGHVYYVGAEWLTATEQAVMRMLPRVPHVTLETGRPADEVHSAGSLAFFREGSRSFVATPFEPLPVVEPVRPRFPPIRMAFRGYVAKTEAPASVRAQPGRGRNR